MSQSVFWDDRFRAEEYAYGESPNVYFKNKLKDIIPGKILLPLEGEGRNAVYAAQLGWEVYAFDFSEEGRKKALRLAELKHGKIQYDIIDVSQYNPSNEEFDVLGLFFAHFPPEIRKSIHQKLLIALKPGGKIILEGFSKEHIHNQAVNPRAGGPADLAMLFSEDMIRNDFSSMRVLELQQIERDLEEGLYHQGKASLIQFMGQKTGIV